MGNLLRFLQGEDKPFRILVDLVGETVFLTRRENTPRELIPDVRGYGHAFPEAYTTWDPEVKGSISHQRVVSYRFGGLSFLLRFEGDGYITGKESNEENSYLTTSSTNTLDVDAELDLLSTAFAGNQLTSKMPGDTDNGLKVLRAGKLVKQHNIFDLKTRAIWKKETETFEATVCDQSKRLWVTQIQNLILAYHTRGVFDDILVRNVQAEVNDWETTHVDVLSRLAALIRHIIDLVRARSDHKIELRHDAVGVLEIREQLADAGDVLSEPMKKLWEDGDDHRSRDSFPGANVPEVDSALEDSRTSGWDEDFVPDFTACSAEDCGYCGRCRY